MAIDLAVEHDGMAAQPAVEGDGARDDRRIRTEQLHQRHEMRRVERMGDDDAARMGAIGGNDAVDKRRGAAADDDIGRQRGIDPAQQGTLHLRLLRTILLHELRASQRGGEIGGECQFALAGQAKLGKLCASLVQMRAQPRLGGGVRVKGRDIEPWAQASAAQLAPISPEPMIAMRLMSAIALSVIRPGHSAFRPVALMSALHFAISLSISAEASAGVPGLG